MGHEFFFEDWVVDILGFAGYRVPARVSQLQLYIRKQTRKVAVQ